MEDDFNALVQSAENAADSDPDLAVAQLMTAVRTFNARSQVQLQGGLADRLEKELQRLLQGAKNVANKVHAASYSVGVTGGVPIGASISITVTFNIPPAGS